MKRTQILLLFLSVLSMLFAADSSDTRTSNINDGNTLTIRGFYEASDENIIQFMITEAESGAQVLHAGVITTTQDAGAPADIFDWVLKGNYNGTVTLTFRFATLQGYKNEGLMYYIPRHEFVLSLNATRFYTDSEYQNPDPSQTKADTFYSGNVADKAATFNLLSSGNYPYPDHVEVVDDQTVVTPVTKEITLTYTGNITDSNPPPGGITGYWVRSGTCSLEIFQYEAVQGIIQYTSTIQVEVGST